MKQHAELSTVEVCEGIFFSLEFLNVLLSLDCLILRVNFGPLREQLSEQLNLTTVYLNGECRE